jgi:hypothetical protein
MMIGINFRSLGCWEITGRYEEDQLTGFPECLAARSPLKLVPSGVRNDDGW